MKYLLSLTLALSLLQYAGAQGISAGFRTGIGNTMNISRMSEGIIDKHWEKELFLRYETKKRLALEINGTQYNDAEAGIWHSTGCIVDYEPILTFESPTRENLLTYTSYNMLDMSLGVQYDISCSYLQEKCPMMKNFRSFIGVAAVGTYGKVTTRSTDRSLSDGDITTTERTGSGLYNLHIGVNHTLTYSFGRLYVTSVAAYLVSPFSETYTSHNQLTPNSKLSFRAGIGYRIH